MTLNTISFALDQGKANKEEVPMNCNEAFYQQL
jgi:hypothetical protein